ncbi:MAG TPA: ferrochelatase [Kiritimatiellia bacterium]|nr:ferrochelatase [Kiritimatiellia bacterium]
MNSTYDAILIMSFGGPEGMNDVMPFLDNVLRGRNVPEARKKEVAHHYELFGGVSPINRQNEALRDALVAELARHGITLPVHLGNRNWKPFVTDIVRDMKDAGVEKFLAFVTSGFSCYSGCRQYREDMMRACEAAGYEAPIFDKIRVYYNHPDFIAVTAEHWRQALASFPEERRERVHTAFTAHSIPMAMAERCAYDVQLRTACELTAEAAGIPNWKLVYQSRSGPPHQPWLDPDICDHIRDLHAQGVRELIVHPIGFISDHMEVLYDLDHEALDLCQELGITMKRAATPGVHPRFVSMVAELIRERMDPSLPKRALGSRGPNHDVCPVNCCQSGRPG